ncbi:probable ATP-dependent RNA helicase DDX10 [Pseudochaenichthys georgianus]|uniref:probable ATP-dependent RNA helicase DDX10 n=1 Tax=Pseudochaenichthys georgianus TaxID=52239 RepID=UPI00146E8EF8|nr:probable ATP-dependent RNA helicase DDX10 [Pseudochaenichthys georgianus]
MEKKSTGNKPKPAKMKDSADPVRNFEKWKKKYNKTKARVKSDRAPKKPEWQVEREYIEKLVSRYPDINSKEAVRFSDFPISKKTLLGLQGMQYRQPTEIQRQTIGYALQGKDVLGAAKTGSGKTLAFLIPVLECLYRQQWSSVDGLGALIISPTRELAYQTYEVLRKVGKNHEFSAGLIIGGKDLKSESERIHNTNIVICTPGRLLQHMDETATFLASDLHMLVLDEADRILDMGFADTLNAIVENLPKTRQTLLFSATQTKSVKDLARLSLKDPEYVWVHEKAKFSTPATLEQSYVVCELHLKVNMLFSFIRSHLKKKIIVFFACCKEVQYLFRVLCRLRPGMPILALHGKQQQMKRVEVYNDFLRKQNAVLLATDIAARGLDFPTVNWVLQFDCPEDADTYIHRVGRTARYKEGGEALLLLLPSEEKGMIGQLQEKKVPINKIQVNPEKLQNIQQKLQAFLAQEQEQKERAQRCFVSYLRSVFLMKNKEVFNAFNLKLNDYAHSLGLAVAPRVRFLSKAQAQKEEKEAKREEKEESEEEVELKSFKAQLKGNNPEESQSSESDESGDEEGGREGDEDQKVLGLGADSDEDEDDLRDLDLLTVKRKDVFNLTGDGESSGEPDEDSNVKVETETKFKEAKKILKRNFQVNTKVTFSEEGQAVQTWPPVQRAVTADDEDEGVSGINMEKARARLKREDQEFDKLEYRRKVKAKHTEKRLKAKAARKETSKHRNKSDDEEDEVIAYLANHSDDEFDPSSLPDPDKVRSEEEEEEEEEMTAAKRQHSSGEEEEEHTVGKRKKARQEKEDNTPLDTGLSLAEDEELVLHLLGGGR